jgi:hypothetical protein
MSIASLYPSINPSLLLDFANSKVLDPRITFTRTTTATYYDGVTTAKAEENLLTYSQEFDNAAWSKALVTITSNATTAPDGTSTADLAVANTTNGDHSVVQSFTFPADTTLTISCYMKAAGYDYGVIRHYSAGNGDVWASFNLSTGAVDSNSSGVTASITSVGSSWYRCVMTKTYSSATSGNSYGIRVANAGGIGTPFAGNGTSGIYIWGAQLEQRSSATAYTATTSQAITNYIPVLQTASAGQARFDHNPTTGESLGLLIEEARTNSITYSSDFSNAAWTKLGVTITSNTIVAPDGTLTGDKVVPSVSQTYNQNYSSLTLLTGTNYAISCYAKKGEYSYLNLALIYNASNYAGAQFDLNAGSVLYTRASGFGYSVVSTSIAPVGNGWYRCVVVATSGLTGIYPNVVASNSLWTSGYPDIAITADGFSGVYIWGAQLETGSFATSYIPTVALSVTRNADAASMTGTNFSSWFNNGEGTVYFEAQPMYVGAGVSGLNAIAWDGSVNNLISAGQNGGMGQATAADFYIATNNVTQTYVSSTSISTSSAFKIVGAYEFNNSSAYLNATIMGSLDTSCTIPVVNQLKIDGNLGYTNRANGWVRKLSYYPQRLSATNLAALTT